MRDFALKALAVVIVAGAFCGCGRAPSGGEDAENAGEKAVSLITPDLSNFEFDGQRWEYQDGVVARVGEGNLHDLWIKGEYGDFILEVEYKLSERANSGVLLRCTDKVDWMNTALEVQIIETGDGTVHGQCGGVYDCISPNFIEPAHLEVAADGDVTIIPLVLNHEYTPAEGTVIKIARMYKNYQTVVRSGKVIPYEGSDTGWNPALYVSVKIEGEEEMILLEGEKPVKAENGDCTLVFRTEKRIAEKDAATPAGEWHTMKVKAQGNIIEAWSNGRKVLTMDVNEWTEAGWNPQGTKNKYPVALKDMPRRGYVGLQDHGLPVWFRNVKFTVLDKQ